MKLTEEDPIVFSLKQAVANALACTCPDRTLNEVFIADPQCPVHPDYEAQQYNFANPEEGASTHCTHGVPLTQSCGQPDCQALPPMGD